MGYVPTRHSGKKIAMMKTTGQCQLCEVHPMNMLYDSETFSVVHVDAHPMDNANGETREGPQMPRHGFEIVDKRSNKELFLDGAWAELFQERLSAWLRQTPTQDEVESTLEGYATLAQNPLVLH